MLTCPMFVASRQLYFWKRLNLSKNRVVMCALQANRGNGLLASNHVRLREYYDIVPLDLSSTGKTDIQNVFKAMLNRIVAERQRVAEPEPG